jgi:mitotic spindle assembly checkpoint protein MAD1
MSSASRGLKRPLSQIDSANHDQELSRMRLQIQAMKLEHENTRKGDLLNLRTAEGKVDKLQRHLEFLNSEISTNEGSQRQSEEAHMKEKHELEKAKLDLQSKISDLEVQVQAGSSTSATQHHELGRKLEIAETKVQSLEKHNAVYQEQSEAFQQEINRLKQEAIKASMPSARKPFTTITEPETPSSALGSARELREQIREGEARERQLHAKVQELQEIAQNVSVQDEKLKQLQARLQKSDATIAKNSENDVQLEQLLAEKQEWHAQFSKLMSEGTVPTSETTPMQAVKFLQSMRQEKLVLHRHMGEMQSHLREAEERAELAEKKVVQEGSKRAGAEAKTTELEDKLATLKNQMVYVSKRKESLEKLLASYDTEFKMLPASGGDSASREAVLDKRIKELEAALEASEQQVKFKKQESETRTPPAMLAKARERAREMEAACTAAEAAKAKILKQLEKTEGELALLESRLGKGEYDPSKTKVVHFACNPSEMLYKKQKEKKLKAKDAEKLVKENEELRAKLKALESASRSISSVAGAMVCAKMTISCLWPSVQITHP